MIMDTRISERLATIVCDLSEGEILQTIWLYNSRLYRYLL